MDKDLQNVLRCPKSCFTYTYLMDATHIEYTIIQLYYAVVEKNEVARAGVIANPSIKDNGATV